MATEFGAAVGGEDDFEGFEGLREAGPLHVAVFVEGVEELLELGLVGVVADVAAIEHLHGEVTPGGFVCLEFVGVEFVVEEAALAADEVGVEVVGLEAVDDGGAFANAAVFEFDDGDAGGVVLVGGEDLALGFGGEAGDGFDVVAHAEEEGVHGVATSGEEGAATVFFAGVPAELAIPGADAVVVVDFSVVNGAEQTLVDHGFGGDELAGEAAFEADAAMDAIGFGSGGDVADFLEGVGHGFLQDDVFFGVGGGDGLVAVLAGVGGDVDDVNARIGEHVVEVLVGGDGAAVFGAEFGAIEGAGGEDGGDLSLFGGVDGVDVRRGCPSVSDNADVVFFHGGER